MPAAVDEQTAKARTMSEGNLFNEVATLLKRLGWRYHHVPATAYRKNHIPAGFPDIVAVKGGRLLFIELKREKEKLSIEQAEWMHDLLMVFARNAGARHFVWRPSDLLAGRIDEVLAG
jgi:Holliday junction resolvase